jgi:hypothetical protein
VRTVRVRRLDSSCDAFWHCILPSVSKSTSVLVTFELLVSHLRKSVPTLLLIDEVLGVIVTVIRVARLAPAFTGCSGEYL